MLLRRFVEDVRRDNLGRLTFLICIVIGLFRSESLELQRMLLERVFWLFFLQQMWWPTYFKSI